MTKRERVALARDLRQRLVESEEARKDPDRGAHYAVGSLQATVAEVCRRLGVGVSCRPPFDFDGVVIVPTPDKDSAK